ncbi:hypothetical protein OXB_2182 [Bacillus sp. OxB-1]|uniref:hypothetical protein n=1 Tax=Bacillus sp. (strain OxB-1) TaxID=98228 RepID=UPI000581E5D3|nr:hypothetical protein [Bacillus sp. OxB-1]BAQ10653.1 hypothetical protein OXB_2182 [Bacillus sp. OxB-1]
MDKKQQQLVQSYYEQFNKRWFDEKYFYGFLQLVREEADDIPTVKALCDFVLDRGQSAGLVKEYLTECQQIIGNLGNAKSPKRIDPVFSFKEIRNGFNALFAKWGWEKLPHDVINDFILCLISLLQGVPLISEASQKKVGHLSFAASSKEVFLMGNMQTLHNGRMIPVTFPVLSVKNMYEKITPRDAKDTPYLFDEELIEIINMEGQMVITFPTIGS